MSCDTCSFPYSLCQCPATVTVGELATLRARVRELEGYISTTGRLAQLETAESALESERAAHQKTQLALDDARKQLVLDKLGAVRTRAERAVLEACAKLDIRECRGVLTTYDGHRAVERAEWDRRAAKAGTPEEKGAGT